MKRAMSSLVAVSLVSTALASTTLLARAQDQPTTPLPSGILGPQLIVWSQAQRPQPVPQPLPDPPEQQAKKQPEQPANPQPAEQAAKRTFTGKIVKDAGHYVLKVSNERVYQLDDEQKAKEYEGKDVRVVGTLDANGTILRVSDIELIA